MSKELPNPSKISLLLGMTYKEVEQVIYFVNYVVIKNPRCKKFYGPCQIIPINDPKGNEKARQNIRAALEIIIKDLEKDIKTLSKNTSKNLEKLKEITFDHEMASQYATALKDTTLPFSLHTVFALLKKYLDIEISIGSAAIKQLLQAVDLNKKYKEVKSELSRLTPSNPKFTKQMNCLKLIK
ncbi:MAG: hypothetical protein MJ219_04260 [Mycoplasmoidaceae bacterium]|nr:hypothetical protein [Mycoplasmoidaceae bacterium]